MKRHERGRYIDCALGVLLLVCSVALLVANEPRAVEILRFEPYQYDYHGQRIQAELGRLAVPEHYDHPTGRTITLAFLRLKSTSPRPGPPVIYLAGGPGGSAIRLAKGPRGAVFLAMRDAGDVIALEQRGVGLSQPNLDCPGNLGFPLNAPGDRAALLAAFERESRACATYWRTRGIDLAAYNSVESAHDINAVRQALGVDKVRLWGSSYGTTLGLATMRHHGAIVDRAVFAGVEGPDDTLKFPSTAQHQLRTLAALVAADPALPRAIPDFEALVTKVLSAVALKPLIVSVPDPKTDRTVQVTVGRFDVEQLVISMLGDRGGLERLPRLLLDLDHGQFSSAVVQKAVSELVEERTGSIGSAMAFATDCASGASPARLTRIAHDTRAGMLAHLDFPIPDVCPAWGLPALPAGERLPVHSEVPTLFISGTLDGRTPPQNAQDVRAGFLHSAYVLINGAGHGDDLFVSSPQIQQVMVEFMKTGRVDRTSIALPPLQFQ